MRYGVKIFATYLTDVELISLIYPGFLKKKKTKLGRKIGKIHE